jgi:hypothetical protein
MKLHPFYSLLLAALVLFPAAGRVLAQDNVTVPKSRLEELERKERELEKLQKGPASGTTNSVSVMPPVIVAPAPAPGVPAAAKAGDEAAKSSSPAIASLPPLGKEDVVQAVDLGNYYHDDAASADKRFRKQKFVLHGVVVGFEKPLFIRNYRILLKTAHENLKIMCDLLPPDKVTGVFTTDHGSQLVFLSNNDTRNPIVKVGETIQVKGECKGLNGSVVRVDAWDLGIVK